MNKAQNTLQTNDGELGDTTVDRTSSRAAMAAGETRNEAWVGQASTDVAAGPGPRSLLADPAEAKGRRSLFRR